MALKSRKHGNKEFNRAMHVFSEYYNEDIDGLMLLSQEKGATHEEIGEAMGGISRQAIQVRFKRIQQIRSKPETEENGQ